MSYLHRIWFYDQESAEQATNRLDDGMYGLFILKVECVQRIRGRWEVNFTSPILIREHKQELIGSIEKSYLEQWNIAEHDEEIVIKEPTLGVLKHKEHGCSLIVTIIDDSPCFYITKDQTYYPKADWTLYVPEEPKDITEAQPLYTNLDEAQAALDREETIQIQMEPVLHAHLTSLMTALLEKDGQKIEASSENTREYRNRISEK